MPVTRLRSGHRFADTELWTLLPKIVTGRLIQILHVTTHYRYGHYNKLFGLRPLCTSWASGEAPTAKVPRSKFPNLFGMLV